MGFHLTAGTLNQAALARGRAALAAAALAGLSPSPFVGWMLAPIVDDELAARRDRLLRAATFARCRAAAVGLYRRDR